MGKALKLHTLLHFIGFGLSLVLSWSSFANNGSSGGKGDCHSRFEDVPVFVSAVTDAVQTCVSSSCSQANSLAKQLHPLAVSQALAQEIKDHRLMLKELIAQAQAHLEGRSAQPVNWRESTLLNATVALIQAKRGSNIVGRFLSDAQLLAQGRWQISRSLSPDSGLGPLESIGYLFKVSALSAGTFLGRVLNPLSFIDGYSLKRRDAQVLFKNLRENPSHALTPEEVTILKTASAKGRDLVSEYDKLQKALLRRPVSRQILSRIRTTVGALLALNFAMVLHQNYILSLNTISIEEHVKKHKLNSDTQVQLIIENFPLPHTSIRVGNKVYSFGFTHLDGSSRDVFLQSRKFSPMAKADPNASSLETLGPDFYNALGQFPVSKALIESRSVRVITFGNLPSNEVIALRERLETEIGMSYDNRTGVNDCNTMAIRRMRDTMPSVQDKLSSVLPLIDAIPSSTSTVLAFQTYFNDETPDSKLPYVKMELVMLDPYQNKSWHQFVDSYMGILEGKFLLNTMFLPSRPDIRSVPVIDRLLLDEAVANGEHDLVSSSEGRDQLLEKVRSEIAQEYKKEFSVYFPPREALPRLLAKDFDERKKLSDLLQTQLASIVTDRQLQIAERRNIQVEQYELLMITEMKSALNELENFWEPVIEQLRK
jgi:hypothetical protein